MKVNRSLGNRCVEFSIVILQYLYLGYYLNLSNVKFSNDILMIVALAVILISLIIWIITHNKQISKCLILALLGSCWSILCSIFNGSGLGSTVTQTCVLLSIGLFSEVSFSCLKWKRMMLRMFVILALVLCVFSKPDIYLSQFYARLSYFPSTTSMNPNTIAMLSFFLLVYLSQFIEVSVGKTQLRRFLQVVFGLVVAGLIWITGARTSMLAGAVFIIYLIFFGTAIQGRCIKRFILIALICSLLVPVIYLAMYNNSVEITYSEDFSEKGFYSGREQVWQDAFERIIEHPIFGSSNKLPFSQMNLLSAHNSLLAVLCYYGFIGLIICMSVLHKAFKNLHPVYNKMPMVAILCATFIMCFETVLTDWSLVWPFCFLFVRIQEKTI